MNRNEMTYDEAKAGMTKDVLKLIEKHFPEIDQSKISFDFEKLEISIKDLKEEYKPVVGTINTIFKRLKANYEANISRHN